MPSNNFMRRATRLSTFVLLCGVLSTPARTLLAETTPSVTVRTQSSDDIYTLHHAVIPGILFSDKGTQLFNDLFTGNTKPFLDIIEPALGKNYVSGMKIVPEHHQDFDIVLISFPAPETEPLCYQAALVKKGEILRYITLEKGNNGSKAFLCEWTADHTHHDYGARNAVDGKAFRNDLLTFLKK
jgi:hypothetical protein